MHVDLDFIWPGAATAPVPLLAPSLLTTPWASLTATELAPGAVGGAESTAPREVAHVLLAGTLEYRDGETRLQLEAPAVVVGGAAPPPLRNPGPAAARYLSASVDLDGPGPVPAPRAEAANPAVLQWRDAIHGGAGRLATRHLWRPQEFASAWTFIDHAVLGVDASVGYHYHDALEEAFVVLAGRGRMTIADRTFAVGPGAVTFQGIGAGHGIYNPGPEELAFLRLAVARPGETYTTVDLDDDLRDRRAGPAAS